MKAKFLSRSNNSNYFSETSLRLSRIKTGIKIKVFSSAIILNCTNVFVFVLSMTSQSLVLHAVHYINIESLETFLWSYFEPNLTVSLMSFIQALPMFVTLCKYVNVIYRCRKDTRNISLLLLYSLLLWWMVHLLIFSDPGGFHCLSAGVIYRKIILAAQLCYSSPVRFFGLLNDASI